MSILSDVIATESFEKGSEILSKLDSSFYVNLLDGYDQIRQQIQKKDKDPYDDAKEHKERDQLDLLKFATFLAHASSARLPAKIYLDQSVLSRPQVVAKLSELRPAWLESALYQSIEGRVVFLPRFDTLYPYLKSGVLSRPLKDESYYDGVPYAMGRELGCDAQKIRALLLEDRGLVVHDYPVSLRRMSQVGSYHFRRHPAEGGIQSMAATVSDLVQDGHFERAPLIQACLEGMLACQREVEARNLAQIHNDWKSSSDDYIQHLSSYCSLLSSSLNTCKKTALTAILEMIPHPGFSAELVVSEIPAAVQTNSNPLQLLVVKVLAQTVKLHPEVAACVPAIIAPLFLNQNPKVQKQVVKLMLQLPDKGLEKLPSSLEPYGGSILATFRPDLEPWLSSEDSFVEASSMLEGSSMAKLLPIGQQLKPASDIEDLYFIAGTLPNRKACPYQLELFLDGIARFASKDLDKLRKGLASTAKRATKFHSGVDSNGGDYPWVTRFGSELILLLGDTPLPNPSWLGVGASDNGPIRFLRHRINEVLRFINECKQGQLLSTPESSFGFISASTLCQRVGGVLGKGGQVLHYDFTLALARCYGFESLDSSLLPEGDDEVNRVLHFLHTGEVRGSIETVAWWLSAARTREPMADFSQMIKLAEKEASVPDAVIPAAYRSAPQKSYDWRDESIKPCMEVTPPSDWIYPLQQLACISDYGQPQSDIQWYFSLTPSYPDALIATGLEYITRNAELTEKTELHAVNTLMQEVMQRELPLRYPLQVLLVMSLASPVRQAHEYAVDLWEQAVRLDQFRGRLESLGDIIAQVFVSNRYLGYFSPDADYDVAFDNFPLNRVTPLLRQLQALGAPMDQYLCQVLTRAFEAELAYISKGLPGLIELFHELITRYPPQRAIDLNSHWKGKLKGKADTVARKIAAIQK